MFNRPQAQMQAAGGQIPYPTAQMPYFNAQQGAAPMQNGTAQMPQPSTTAQQMPNAGDPANAEMLRQMALLAASMPDEENSPLGMSSGDLDQGTAATDILAILKNFAGSQAELRKKFDSPEEMQREIIKLTQERDNLKKQLLMIIGGPQIVEKSPGKASGKPDPRREIFEAEFTDACKRLRTAHAGKFDEPQIQAMAAEEAIKNSKEKFAMHKIKSEIMSQVAWMMDPKRPYFEHAVGTIPGLLNAVKNKDAQGAILCLIHAAQQAQSTPPRPEPNKFQGGPGGRGYAGADSVNTAGAADLKTLQMLGVKSPAAIEAYFKTAYGGKK